MKWGTFECYLLEVGGGMLFYTSSQFFKHTQGYVFVGIMLGSKKGHKLYILDLDETTTFNIVITVYPHNLDFGKYIKVTKYCLVETKFCMLKLTN